MYSREARRFLNLSQKIAYRILPYLIISYLILTLSYQFARSAKNFLPYLRELLISSYLILIPFYLFARSAKNFFNLTQKIAYLILSSSYFIHSRGARRKFLSYFRKFLILSYLNPILSIRAKREEIFQLCFAQKKFVYQKLALILKTAQKKFVYQKLVFPDPPIFQLKVIFLSKSKNHKKRLTTTKKIFEFPRGVRESSFPVVSTLCSGVGEKETQALTVVWEKLCI